jgi:hypothetical protein
VAVTIRSESELETLAREVVLYLDKMIYVQGGDAKLEGARRNLVAVRDALHRKEKLTQRQVQALNESAVVLREVLKDQRINDLLWDMQDFFELNPP